MTLHGFNKRVLEFLQGELALQKGHGFLWWPVFLGVGIGLYFLLRFEPPFLLGLVAVLGCVSGFVLMRGRMVATGLFFLCLVSVGFFAAQLRTLSVATPMLERETAAVMMVADIDEIERLEPGQGSRIVFRGIEIEGDRVRLEKIPVRVRLRVRKDEGLKIGQRVRVLAKLMPPSPPVMPGGFDFQRYMYFKRIGAVGFAFQQPEVIEPARIFVVRDGVEKMREAIAGRVRQHLEHPGSAFANALMIAERKEIAEEDAQAMRDSGLAHLLAISGLHVGLFSGVVFFVMRLFMACFSRFALRHPIKKYAAIVAFVAACLYAVLAGAPISTQRAVIMVGVVFLAVLLDRAAISLRLVAFAACCVLLLQPESLLSASFHMSFAAVAGLIAFYEWLRPYSTQWYSQSGIVRRMALYFVSAVMTSLIASLATAPFVLFHFQQMPTYSILANVIAVPLMAFVIMPSAVLALFLMPLGVEYGALQVMGFGIAQVLDIAHWFADVPGGVVQVPAYPVAGLVLFVLGGLILILWRGRLKAVSVGVFLLAFVSLFAHRSYDILVSSEFNLMMVRDDAGMFHISSRRAERFSAENWESSYGLDAGTAEKWMKEGGDEAFSCDDQACRAVVKGQNVSFLRDRYVLQAECTWADIVLSFEIFDGERCENNVVVLDRLDGMRNGSYGFWVDGDTMWYEAANELRGVRPWVSSLVD